jgi:epoxyqueuosine reductase
MTIDERESLRTAIAALGFDEVRFAAADTPVAGDFAAWLAQGNHADMTWLERGAAKRLDPRLVVPGARTVVLLGVNYLPHGEAAKQARWAKYALYADYHDTIGRGLDAACALLESRAGLRREDYRAYVDTGPVLERGWAAAAGLGWQGKNAMLISRTHGNWLFLAAILARLEVPADEPLRFASATARTMQVVPGSLATTNPETRTGLLCGTCTRCLTACPTDAFPRPGWVDARRCISYHTIENRGIIPRELRAKFGGRVFGCDTCLDVCPWNRFAQAGRSALLAARGEIAGLTLLDLLAMDDARFRDAFRKTPIKRVKLTGLLRNACIAAGNWRDCADWHFGGAENIDAVVLAVEKLCAHESSIVRAHAVWAMFRLLGEEVANARLESMRAAETDALVLEEFAAWDPR